MFDWQTPRPQVVRVMGVGFPSRKVVLGQSTPTADASAYLARAQAAVNAYDDLLKRISNIGDTAARNDLLSWISTSDVPGTPAERRKIVATDMQSQGQGVGLDIATKRVGDLEQMNKTLEAKVKKAEEAYASISNPKAPGLISFSGSLSPTGIALGAVSVLGLLVVPLMLRAD